jgi:chemotaxis protein methyltransferase CheR
MANSPATPAEIRQLALYLSEVTGIVLDESKGYLFESRLFRIAEEQGCTSLACLLDRTQRDQTGKLREALVDAVTTHETSFFREPQQFDLLMHKVIPEHFEKRNSSQLRIWCAAASTGQEVYSVGMILKEMLGSFEKYRIQIVGTDIAGSVLERASKGSYTQLEVSRGLRPDRIERHFVAKGDEWVIRDDLRGIATFQRMNLLEPPPLLGSFDIVLCRNVAIYFSPENRAKLFNNIATRMRHGAVLLVSTTENLGNSPKPFVRHEFRALTYYLLP